MRGKLRTKEERHELFAELERYLSMGFSLKKACHFADLPYSTIRDITSAYEPLRARTAALQNSVNVTARANIIQTIEQGDINNSKWWLERFDHTEPQISPVYGGMEEAALTVAETKVERETETLEEGALRLKEFFS